MAVWERQTQKLPCKGPSFSSSLLDAIYHSIDESRIPNQQQVEDTFVLHRRKNGAQVEEDIESLRRAIMVEKWIENYSTDTTRSNPRHFSSNSDSSTDSSMFSSSETESSVSRSTPTKSSIFHSQNLKRNTQTVKSPKRDGRLKSKIYGELKKVKEPISPAGKVANFLNSIFSPRNLKANQGMEEWSSIRKSRSMKDTTTTTTCSLGSRSCLSKNLSSGGSSKSKRSVRFCPVNVIVDEDSQPCGHKSVYYDESIGSKFIKKNIDNLRLYEGRKVREDEFRDCYQNECDVDGLSCGSSELFELENIGRVGIGAYAEELPVYGTTSL